jgi:hypothetical protein
MLGALDGIIRVYRDAAVEDKTVEFKTVKYRGEQGRREPTKLDIKFYAGERSYGIDLPTEYPLKERVAEWVRENITATASHPNILLADLDDLVLFKLRWEGQIYTLNASDISLFYCPYMLLSTTKVNLSLQS